MVPIQVEDPSTMGHCDGGAPPSCSYVNKKRIKCIYIYIYGTITLFELALPAFISVGPCRRYDGCTLMYGFTCSSRVSSMVVPRRDTREKFCESFLRYSYSIRRYHASIQLFCNDIETCIVIR